MAGKASRVVLSVVLCALGAVAGCTAADATLSPSAETGAAAATAAAPKTGAAVCGKPVLDSPWSYHGKSGTFGASNEPKGLPTIGKKKSTFPWAKKIIVVPPGNNTAAGLLGTYQVNFAVVYFEPGMHKIEQTIYAGHNSAYVGGYTPKLGKAILNGVDGATGGTGRGGSGLEVSKPASGSRAYNTWEYLTIENYASTLNNSVLGHVNGGAIDVGDKYKYLTVGPNQYGYVSASSAPRHGEDSGGGYAIDAGTNTVIEDSCLTQNAQGAFNSEDSINLTIDRNEISKNGIGVYPDMAGTPGGSPFSCGCSGGGKIFYSENASFVGNYVHDNYNNGVWFDFDNAGANISHNYIASNWGSGIMYEGSYNANISDNTLVGNGWASHGSWPAGLNGGSCYGGVSCSDGLGPITGKGGGNPYGAIDLSNSGGNPNLLTHYRGHLFVEGNVLLNNFGGVKVYTDTNRFPGNVSNDSACSIPLGVLGRNTGSKFYKQGHLLVTNGDATLGGKTVTVSAGTQTICAKYGQAVDDGYQTALHAPSAGMAVFNENSGKFLGNVVAVKNSHSFTLDRSVESAKGQTLLLSAYGGCGPADYFGGNLRKASGQPSNYYWDNCLWGSRDVTVKGNVFTMNAKAVRGCTVANYCGYNEDAAFDAGVPKLMRYFYSYETFIAKASGGLGNVWSDNTYKWTGSSSGWLIMAGAQSRTISWSAWRAGPYSQDKGSVRS